MNIELIGERLKKIRQEKGLTLEDVQKKTHVHINILKAIEGETLTNLSPVYLKGFIKMYCLALGVDPKDYVPDYKESSSGPVLVPRKNSGSFLKNASEKIALLRPNKIVKKVIIIVLAVLVSFMVLTKIFGCISSGFSSRRANQAKMQPKVQQQGVLLQQINDTRIPKEASGGIRLVVSAKENCLVYVKCDGRVVFHRVLERGRSDSWKAKERIDLSLGNASAVDIVVNGQRFSSLGRKGRPLNNIVITEKDGLRIPR